MDKSLELFVKFVRESTRFVNRDFFELESMQSSAKKNYEFANKTCQKVVECYIESMTKSNLFPDLVFTAEDLAAKQVDKSVVLIEVLDGVRNLAKSLPYFASIATKMVRKGADLVAEQSVMIMHGNNELYYAMAGKGAWKESLYGSHTGASRLRVASSNSKDTKTLMIGTSYPNLTEAAKLSENIRIFGADSFICAMVASGKLDVGFFAASSLTKPAYKLFVQESGGVFIEKNDVQIATNIAMQTLIN